jgi:hypothetical protein
MRYLLLLYGEPADVTTLAPEAFAAVARAHGEFTAKLQAAGALVDSAPLLPDAKTVRLRRRERLVTDGPFAETKEQLGGYYLIEAGSLDDAVAWAHELEPIADGAIEVRPIADVAVDSGPARSS